MENQPHGVQEQLTAGEPSSTGLEDHPHLEQDVKSCNVDVQDRTLEEGGGGGDMSKKENSIETSEEEENSWTPSGHSSEEEDPVHPSGYTQLSQDSEPEDLQQEQLSREDITLEENGHSKLAPKLSKWLERQVDELNRSVPSSSRSSGCRGASSKSPAGAEDWAKFEELSVAEDDATWPRASAQPVKQRRGKHSEQQVQPVTRMAEG